MIDGFAILSQYKTSGLIASVAFMIFILALFLFVFYLSELKKKNPWIIAAGILVMVACLACIGGFRAQDRIEALVSESASWVKINERYEYIENRGKIYVFKERKLPGFVCDVCGK